MCVCEMTSPLSMTSYDIEVRMADLESVPLGVHPVEVVITGRETTLSDLHLLLI